MASKQNSVNKADAFCILIVVFLVTLVFFDLYGVKIGFLFVQTGLGTTIFGLISLILITLYFIVWSIPTWIERLNRKENLIKIYCEGFEFIGLRKPTNTDLLFVSVSFLVGAVYNHLIHLVMAQQTLGTLGINPNYQDVFNTLFNSLIIAPIFEEIIFRGIYLSVFIRILGEKHFVAILGIIMSSLTFGWIHTINPIPKFLGGILLGSIYLFKWKKSLIASMTAHFGANLIPLFIYVLSK